MGGFSKFADIECSTLIASSFTILNSSAGISSPLLTLLAYRWSLKVILSSSHDLYRRSVWGHYCCQQRLKKALAGVHLPRQGGRSLKFTQSFFGTLLQMEVTHNTKNCLVSEILEFIATSSWFDFSLVLILFSTDTFFLLWFFFKQPLALELSVWWIPWNIQCKKPMLEDP